jgi:hypothetical protein
VRHSDFKETGREGGREAGRQGGPVRSAGGRDVLVFSAACVMGSSHLTIENVRFYLLVEVRSTRRRLFIDMFLREKRGERGEREGRWRIIVSIFFQQRCVCGSLINTNSINQHGKRSTQSTPTPTEQRFHEVYCNCRESM